MARGRTYASAIAAPNCALAAHEQVVSGAPVVSINGQSVQLSEADKRLLRFLAGCDEHPKEAFALWGALQELTGDEYQIVSENFLSNAVKAPGYPDFFTRSELKDLDDAVATAAGQLSYALKNHPDLGVESAALNWPTVDAKLIAKGLHGLHWMSSWDRDRMYADHEKGIGLDDSDFPEPTVRTGHAPEDIDWGIEENLEENEVFNFVLAYSPTMSQMVDVLARRARKLSSMRLSGAKWQTPGKVRFYAKWLCGWLIDVYPDATAYHVASICAPIVWKKFDSDLSSAFEACKKIVDDRKHKREE